MTLFTDLTRVYNFSIHFFVYPSLEVSDYNEFAFTACEDSGSDERQFINILIRIFDVF